jgi:hypothetical protein
MERSLWIAGVLIALLMLSAAFGIVFVKARNLRVIHVTYTFGMVFAFASVVASAALFLSLVAFLIEKVSNG